MSCCDATHLGFEPERAEENRLCSRLSHCVEESFGAILVVAVDDDDLRPFATNYIFRDIGFSEVQRLQTSELHHQTQQRGDDFLARENQHLTQCCPVQRETLYDRQLVDRGRNFVLAPSVCALDILGTNVPPGPIRSEVRNNHLLQRA